MSVGEVRYFECVFTLSGCIRCSESFGVGDERFILPTLSRQQVPGSQHSARLYLHYYEGHVVALWETVCKGCYLVQDALYDLVWRPICARG